MMIGAAESSGETEAGVVLDGICYNEWHAGLKSRTCHWIMTANDGGDGDDGEIN